MRKIATHPHGQMTRRLWSAACPNRSAVRSLPVGMEINYSQNFR